MVRSSIAITLTPDPYPYESGHDNKSVIPRSYSPVILGGRLLPGMILMPYSSTPAPRPTALLFELSGGLVDFGARTLPVGLQRQYPQAPAPDIGSAPPQALASALGRAPHAHELQALQQTLTDAAGEHCELTPGATQLLLQLQELEIPYTWLSDLPPDTSTRLSEALPPQASCRQADTVRPWPAPDACWQALSQLQIDTLDGCILISGNPRLLRAGLNAGCWTIGLAACGPLCGLAPADWQALNGDTREQLRAQATLELYRLGAHSVIDHLGEIGPSLEDIGVRRLRGEKP